MISKTAQTNTFVSGMNMDTDVVFLGTDQYRYAENVRLVTNDGGTTGVLQNIEGVKKYDIELPEDETIIGTCVVDKYVVIVTKTGVITKVYRIDDFESDTPAEPKVILKGNLGISNADGRNLSIVGNYETNANIKIYFTDGTSSIKVVNILSDKYAEGTTSGLVDDSGNILNPAALDITPGAVLPPFNLTGLYKGNLPVGVVQYCYQLFNLHNNESTLSTISPTINLTPSDTSQDSQEYEGGYPGESAGKAVQLSAPLITKDFDKCRVLRVLYTDNNEIPQIHIVDEFDIQSNDTLINYLDRGNAYLGELTVEEFNNLLGYQFFANSLCVVQNRLFAANITEDTWDPGWFDCRAYRCNSSGKVRIESYNTDDTIEFTGFDEASMEAIPENHDCINPYNNTEYITTDTDDKYMYGDFSTDGSYILGGSGLNVSYRFVTTSLDISPLQTSTTTSKVDNTCSMNVMATTDNQIKTSVVGTTTTITKKIDENGSIKHIHNYADPFIASKYTGYLRDEVYRFGIIFYNNKHVPSPVYWIADIKMPHNEQVPMFTQQMYDDLLDLGVSFWRLTGNALGIQFSVKNLPEGAVGYDIVRCDRTENDRSVLMQCVGTNVYEYAKVETDRVNSGDDAWIESSVETRPNVFPDFTSWSYFIKTYDDEGGMDYSYIYGVMRKDDYLRLIAPEICLQKDAIQQYIGNNSYLEYLGAYSSGVVSTDLPAAKYRIMSNASYVLNPDGSKQSVLDSTNYISLDADVPTTNGHTIQVPIHIKDTSNIGVEGPVLVAKYFIPNYTTNNLELSIADTKYPLDIPYNSYDSGVNAYNVPIGERTYTNWAMGGFTKKGHSDTQFYGATKTPVVTGPAGPCLIAYVPDGIKLERYSKNFTASYDYYTALPIFNVKRKISMRYGGETFTSRQNSIYISTNSYSLVTYSTNLTYGGDTYLNLLDYPFTFIFQGNDISKYKQLKIYIGGYIPFESSINMNLFNGDMAHKTYTSDNYLDGHMLLDPTQRQTYHIQDRPYYVYNSVYSTLNGGKVFVPKSIYAESDLKIGNRIVASQAKTNNEVLDNWTQFKVADYLDVDSKFGSLTNLYNFKNRLYYFQPSAIGIAAVNERALIEQDGIGQLTLGTGGILSRFDYITENNGSSIVNDKSITNSDNVLYWYDRDKNEICVITNGISSLSKTGYVQSYLNEMYDKKRECSLGFFEKKYNEVWFKFYDKSLIFSEQLNKFTSFYTFDPEWTLLFSDVSVGIRENKFYRLNTLDTDSTNGVSKDAKIQFVINKDSDYTKVFDNVRFLGVFKDEYGNILTNKLNATVEFFNKHQTTGKYSLDDTLVDYREDGYRFAIPRQLSSDEDTSLSYPARMRGKYLICNYEFDADGEHLFRIPAITTTYRYSLV